MSQRVSIARSVLVVLLLSSVAAAASRADDLTPPSRVTEVTIYRGAALVTREARFTVGPGSHRVTLAGIPNLADPASIRISGSGSSRLEIGGVEVREAFGVPSLTPEYVALDASLKELAKQTAALTDRLQTLSTLRDFIAGLKGGVSEGTAKGAGSSTGFRVTSWGEAFRFFSTRLDDIAREQRAIEEKKSGLDETAAVARNRLAQIASQDATRRWSAVVNVTAESKGDATLKVTYLAANATWEPAYDARLDPDTWTVSLWSLAQLSQSTGEEWKDVTVILATSMPSMGIDLPVLASLALVDGISSRVTFNSEFVDSLPILGKNYQDVLTLGAGVSDRDGDEKSAPAAKPLPASMPIAVARRSEVAVRFTLPGRYDVPSDGQTHRHVIAKREMPAEIEHRAVPRIAPAAYLVARLHLPAEIALPAGKVQHFVGEDLVGTSWMPERAFGDEIAMSFGPDDRVKLDRKQTVRNVDRHGKFEDTVLRFVTTIESRLRRREVVEVKDRIPVSQDDRFDVELEDTTTAGATTDEKEPGILTWKVPVAPGEKKEIILSYRVRSPRGTSTSALD